MKLHPQWKVSLESYNSRAPEMWSLITRAVDFQDKSVLDLGCGYGDFLIMTHHAGARKITGMDKNSKIISRLQERIQREVPHAPIQLSVQDIEGVVRFAKRDIIICFSVLPYLENPKKLLEKLYFSGKTVLVETQYYGEPYCLDFIKNDKDMRDWLRHIGWTHVTNLGQTDVEIRNAHRTIWRCRNA